MPPEPDSPSTPARRFARRLTVVVVTAVIAMVAIFLAAAWLEGNAAGLGLDAHGPRLLQILLGIAAAMVPAAVIAWYLVRHPPPPFPTPHTVEEIRPLLDREQRRRRHVEWFVHMRWIAIVFSLALILIAVPLTGMIPAPTLVPLLGFWVLLVVANVGFAAWVRRGGRFELQLVVQVVVDLVVLSGLINASGGIENPLYFAYLFHVIIAGILLPKRKAFALTLVAASLFTLVALGEYTGILPHYTTALFPHHHEGVRGAGEIPHAAHDSVFVIGRTLIFLSVLLLSAYLTNLVAERLQQSEGQLEEAARTLMLEHQRLEKVVDTTGVGMMLVAPGAELIWTSRRAARWLDPAGGPPSGTCPLYQAEGGCSECIAERTLVSGRPAEAERSLAEADGRVRTFRHATSPIEDAEGRTVQVVELLEDISVRKALEAEAIHSGKLSMLGQMAAGIAHEIGNPLSSLSTRLHLLARRRDPEFVEESVGLLRRQIERIRKIVQGVALFGRSRRQEWTEWDLNDVVEESLNLVDLDRRSVGIVCKRRLLEPSPRVRGVRDQITQVVLNLLINALEAMPEGGEVVAETARRDGEVLVSIGDTGVGLSDHVRARLFEPFFTTKSGGSGLGLSISHSFVNSHGGRIEVASAEAGGSRFTVVLPAAGAAEGVPEGVPEDRRAG